MRRIALSATGLAVLIAAMIAHASAASTSPVCAGAAMDGSGNQGDLLLGIAGPPDTAVAAGVAFVGGAATPLVVRAADGAWSQLPIPSGGGQVQFEDAAATSAPTDPTVWVVGGLRNIRPAAASVRGRSLRWSSPVDPGPWEDEFLGVATAPDGTVWAVGKHQSADMQYQPLVERLVGSTWSVVATPAVRGSAVLRDVAVAPDGAIWAVGWQVLDPGVTRPLIERWDGATWSVEAAPGEGQLSGVSVAASGEPIAVGWRGADDSAIVTLARSDAGWAPVEGDGEPGRLFSVVAGNPVLAVGARSDGTGLPVAMLVRQDGGWQPVDLGIQPAVPGGSQLLGVTSDGGRFVAVGSGTVATGFGSLAVAGTCGG